MALDLFHPIVPVEQQNPNFIRVTAEDDDAVRQIIQGWANGFVDRDGKFVEEFQRTFNSSFWELYLYAVLKEVGIEADFSFSAPDFVCPKAGLTIEATIASHAQGATPEWQKTIRDITNLDLDGRYLETLARLSNSIDSKVRKYRDSYANLPQVQGRSYIIAVANFGTPDSFQLGDVAMQRLLYDVWEEESFLKDGRIPLPTGLFCDEGLAEVSAIFFSSVATFGKARALSDSKGHFVFQAIRIRNNVEPIHIVAEKENYSESLCDGLRVFHNPFAARPVTPELFDRPDIRQFFLAEDGEIVTTCHPDGDLCMRQVRNFKVKDQ
jgi:hypothetical protein